MAERCGLPDSLSCTVCLEVLKNPVTLQCGHSYCMDCVRSYWDQEDQGGVYSCPQCRHTFAPRPELHRNLVLVDLLANMADTGPTPPPGKDEVSPGEVECDFCSVRKLKAVKSCLVCLASYCATHLQPHYESAAFKRHKLVDVSVSIQDNICSKHDKLLEVYCRSDGQCVCLLCVMDDHRGHDTVSAAAERKLKQQQFGKKKQKYQHGVQEKQKQLQQLKQQMKSLQRSKDAALDQNEKAYAEIVSMAERRRSAVREMIRDQEKAAMTRAEALMERIQAEIRDLRSREEELKQLSLTDDHIQFLQRCRSVLDLPDLQISSGVVIQNSPFDFLKKAISDLREKTKTLTQAAEEMTEHINSDLEPKTRQEFSMYSCSLSLDPNTAFENLLLSEGNKKVSWIKKVQKYPPHTERFTKYDQVLCCEGLHGVCYYEVEWGGPRVEVAVCYKGPELQESSFGCTDQSWSLSLSTSGCTFWHRDVKTKACGPCSSRVGVYLNHMAGSVAFFSVFESGHMELLHRVQAAFSQPLYPGFMVSRGATVKILPSE